MVEKFPIVTEPLQQAELVGAETPADYVKARNEWLEATLNDDPNRSLPVVTLKENPPRERKVIEFADAPEETSKEPTQKLTAYSIMGPAGDKVGFVELVSPIQTNPHEPFKSYINNITTYRDREHQEPGNGYGPAAYLALLKSLPAGHGLRSEGRLREGSLRMWHRFEEKGIARHVPDARGFGDEAFETVF